LSRKGDEGQHKIHNLFLEKITMPINKNNDQRFKILNELLRSPRWHSIREMADIVNEQLEEDGKKPVTDRTIRNDLESMQDIYLVEVT
jgi:hypothetical protein